MIIKNITDIEAFFRTVDRCEGRVELVTGQGDVLNLKSKLSQYVSLASVFQDSEISEIEVIAAEPADTMRLLQYMVQGNKSYDLKGGKSA